MLVLGGSGGVGMFAVQLAKHHWGCFVVASCSSKNAEVVKSLGADKVVLASLCVFFPLLIVSVPGRETAERIAACHSDQGGWMAMQVLDYRDPVFLKGAGMHTFDVILDCVGGDDYWKAFRGSLSNTGVYVTLVGNQRYLADSKSIDIGAPLARPPIFLGILFLPVFFTIICGRV